MIDINDIIQRACTLIGIEEDKLYGISIIKKAGLKIPIELKSSDVAIIYKYPNILKKLQEGNIIYIQKGKAYVGETIKIDSYYDEKVLDSSFETEGDSIANIVYSLEENIKNNKETEKQKIKIGERYGI